MQLLESSTRVMDSIYRKVILRKKDEVKPAPAIVAEEKGHLTLTLRYGEELKIGDAVIRPMKAAQNQIKLSIHAPKSVPIRRFKNGMAVERREPEKK